MITEILLVIIVALLLISIFVKRDTNTKPIESSVTKVLNESGLFIKIGELSGHAQNLTNYTQNLTNQARDINQTLDTKIGELTAHTEDIRQSHKSIEQMLRVPKERAPIGELSLETILSDQLPPDMFGIRQKILDGKIPDAHIKSTVGLICIDSKFPLDNYAKMIESNNNIEKENFKRQFIKDVATHLDKVSTSYIQPQKGSAEFAFAYIPSEGVYYFLMTEIDAYQMLRDYARRGVQVTSPLMISSKIELIKAGVYTKKLSEDTERVKNDIIRLSEQFKIIDESWRIFYSTHLTNAIRKAEDVDQGYKKLRGEFNKVTSFTRLISGQPTKPAVQSPVTDSPSTQSPNVTIQSSSETPIRLVRDDEVMERKK